MAKYDKMMDWLVDIYVNTLNLIQYMHDKYYYEAAELALMDTDLKRTFATGIAGFSHVIDSLSAIKYAKVIWLLKTFMDKLKKHHTYRDSEPTTSILTITSNVVYGKATGAMPDGRKSRRASQRELSPGANPFLQIDFVTELFQACKGKWRKYTCLDTSGNPFTRNEPFFGKFNELMKYTDLFMLDIKHIDDEEHKKLTGQTNKNILDMAQYLSDNGKKKKWIRHVLVPGLQMMKSI